uniref:Uncharacterized protein n=1 Tax=Panagrolaimus superbus TaxID=310955 RepID=A0A914XYP0_9BILA
MNMNEIESCRTLVTSMRVPQLQAVLQTFNPQLSSARKQELIQRIYNLIHDKKTSANTCQRIREVTRTPSLNPQQPSMRAFNQFQRLPHPAYYPAQMRPNQQQQSFSNAFMAGGQMHTNMNPPVVMPGRTGGRAERMSITRLPFYDEVGVVLRMSELQALNGRSGDARSIFSFTIQPEHVPLITYRGDQPTPRYELQLRMFLFDADIEQADDFPPNCVIKVDDNPVALPAIIPTNKPNAEQKRYSRPVDITQYVQSQRINMNRQHKLEIDWFSDRRIWAMGIWLVHRQNATILLDRVLLNGIRRSADETKKKIAVMLDGDDDNIALDQLKISLLCPLMKTRMKIPARTKTCSHLQCFDLLNYLNMNEKRPSWKCPQCSGNAHYDNLIIDQYFVDMLKAVEHNVEEVELSRDGNWKILEVTCDDISDDDDDVSTPKTIKVEETSSTKTNTKSAKKDDAEIITLDDSDDDVNPGSSEPAPRTIPVPSSVSTNFSSEAPTPPTPLTTNGTNVALAKSISTTAAAATRGPQAKQSRLNDDNSSTRSLEYRKSRSDSSSSETSSDSGNTRRRKIPAALRETNGKSTTAPSSSSTATTSKNKSSKKVNESDIITLDSSDEEQEMLPRPARISASRSTTYSYGSTDSNPPQTNGTTNGTSSTVKRPNGLHSDVAQKNGHISTNNLSDEIEYEVADGLTQFVNSIFLRDTRGPSTFTAS